MIITVIYVDTIRAGLIRLVVECNTPITIHIRAEIARTVKLVSSFRNGQADNVVHTMGGACNSGVV